MNVLRRMRWRTKILAGVLFCGIVLIVVTGVFSRANPRAVPTAVKQIPLVKLFIPATPTPVLVPMSGVGSRAVPKLDLQTSGPHQTQLFATSDTWELVWSYDCSKLGRPEEFMISIFDKQGNGSAATPPVRQFGNRGSGVQRYSGPGDHFLRVKTECSWKAETRAATVGQKTSPEPVTISPIPTAAP